MRIAEEDRDYTTFILASGRYCFASLPMDMVCSGELFNNNTDDVWRGSPGPTSLSTMCWAKELKTTDKAWADLIKKLDFILSRMAAKNIKLSPKKFDIGSEVNFGGFRVSWNSKRPEILPDKAKVAALEAIRKKEAESIIGSEIWRTTARSVRRTPLAR